ncbi:hypothetical protein [Bacteroides ilei]|uniref:hypothetical protein n=1 Tax=Bacteroides ilei TaxID=1907658 RepID=UPI00093143E6|nr:hypothetical protein [Bacteroides ilei]
MSKMQEVERIPTGMRGAYFLGYIVVRFKDIVIFRHGIYIITLVVSEQNMEVNVLAEVDSVYNKECNLKICTHLCSLLTE